MKHAAFKHTLFLAAMLALYGCGNGEGHQDKLPEYGHSSAAFTPFVDIMEKMDKNMAAMPSQGDADRDFAAMMKMHHQAAVDMINAQLREGTEPTMKFKAYRMKSDQQKEIAQLDTFLKSGKAGMKTDSFAIAAKRPMPVPDDLNMQSEQGHFDVAFATMMIIHHRGAERMASEYGKWAVDPGLKTMAQNIVATQQAEITEMQDWLKKHEEHGD